MSRRPYLGVSASTSIVVGVQVGDVHTWLLMRVLSSVVGMLQVC